MAVTTALLALLLAVASSYCSGCAMNGFEVTQAQPAANSAMRISSLYSTSVVESHFKEMQKPSLVSNLQQSFTCVDARGDGQHLSTPGGDYSELAMATYAFFQQTGIKPNSTSIGYIFKTFMDKIASPSRPFYFHTDEARLADLYKAVADEGVSPMPVVLPAVAPSDPKVADIWYRNLVKSEFQGCGHLRLMLANPGSYGLYSAYVPQELLRQFFMYWWPTPEDSTQREKVLFSVKRGPLSGKAIAVVVNDGPGCMDKTPAVVAAYRGSSVFVFHQAAVSDFRAKVLAPFFAEIAGNQKFWGQAGVAKGIYYPWGLAIKFNTASFVKRMEDLFTKQLSYTLSNLPPANGVSLFKVAYTVAA